MSRSVGCRVEPAHTFTGAMMPAGKISSGVAWRWAMPCWWQ